MRLWWGTVVVLHSFLNMVKQVISLHTCSVLATCSMWCIPIFHSFCVTTMCVSRESLQHLNSHCSMMHHSLQGFLFFEILGVHFLMANSEKLCCEVHFYFEIIGSVDYWLKNVTSKWCAESVVTDAVALLETNDSTWLVSGRVFEVVTMLVGGVAPNLPATTFPLGRIKAKQWHLCPVLLMFSCCNLFLKK